MGKRGVMQSAAVAAQSDNRTGNFFFLNIGNAKYLKFLRNFTSRCCKSPQLFQNVGRFWGRGGCC